MDSDEQCPRFIFIYRKIVKHSELCSSDKAHAFWGSSSVGEYTNIQSEIFWPNITLRHALSWYPSGVGVMIGVGVRVKVGDGIGVGVGVGAEDGIGIGVGIKFRFRLRYRARCISGASIFLRSFRDKSADSCCGTRNRTKACD